MSAGLQPFVERQPKYYLSKHTLQPTTMAIKKFTLLLVLFLSLAIANAQPQFRVVAFYTAKEDLAHISFVHEAHKWFSDLAAKNHFAYDSTNDWSNLNTNFLSRYQVVIFLDTRPEDPQ